MAGTCGMRGLRGCGWTKCDATTNVLLAGTRFTFCSEPTLYSRLFTGFTVRLRLLVLVVLLSAFVGGAQDFAYTNNNGAISITGYTGTNVVVIIPSMIDGLPVTSISSNAFYMASTLTSLTIPDTVTNIGTTAFGYCGGLTNLVLGNGVKTIEDGAFGGCTSLPSVSLPDSVVSVGDFAFDYCTNLNNAGLGNSLKSIGSSAFDLCMSLTNAVIPSTVTNIGFQAFTPCYNLQSISVSPQNETYSSWNGVLFDKNQTTLIEGPGGIVSYSVPEGTTNIADGAFAYCLKLITVVIPNTMLSIGNEAFVYCGNLQAVTVPDSVTAIGDSAFGACTGLTNLTLGNGVTNIADYMCGSCSSLKNFNIPNTVVTIGTGSFWGSGLTNVIIPNGVTSVGGFLYSLCSNLNTVTISGSVTNIGNNAFSGCVGLTGVYFDGNPPSVGQYVFNAVPATAYYLPGTTGWTSTLGGLPTTLWLPQIQTQDASFGVHTNQFGFNISWANGMTVVVEATSNLANSVWLPLQTNTLTGGTAFFSDHDEANHPSRFYRLRWLQ
jgi:hypothetical protein